VVSRSVDSRGGVEVSNNSLILLSQDEQMQDGDFVFYKDLRMLIRISYEGVACTHRHAPKKEWLESVSRYRPSGDFFNQKSLSPCRLPDVLIGDARCELVARAGDDFEIYRLINQTHPVIFYLPTTEETK
jgi:hypothetical protein